MVRAGVFVSVIAAFYAHAAGADIRIGVAGPMTGAYAWFGEQYQRGTELAVADLNVSGGVLGQRIELLVGQSGLILDLISEAGHPADSERRAFLAHCPAPAVAGCALASVA